VVDVAERGAGLRLRQAHGAGEAAAELVAANTSFCMSVPCTISRLALPVVSRPEPMLTEPSRRRRWPRPRRVGQLHAADFVVLRGAEHAGGGVGLLRVVRGLRQDDLLAVEARLLGVDQRLNGAYFSRAMRSQVSNTASKVSREWSAKRARWFSDSACSQS
jgi:hypothetical protein